MKALLWFTALTWMLASPAINAQAEDDVFLMLAKKSPAFQYVVGVLAQDEGKYGGEVERWLQRPAELGIRDAQSRLCRHHFVMTENRAKARKWCMTAAERGEPHAQAILGAMWYQGGWGFPQSYREAVKLLEPAALQGVVLAQAILAELYKTGKGVPRDFVLAYAMYNAAAAHGHEGSARSRDLLTENFMTPAQIEKAQRISARLPFEAESKCQSKLNSVMEDPSNLAVVVMEVALCEADYPVVGE